MVSTRQFHIHKNTINYTAHMMLMMLRINTAAQKFSNSSCNLTYMICIWTRAMDLQHTYFNIFSSATCTLRWVVFETLQILFTLKLHCMTHEKKHSFLWVWDMSPSLSHFSSWTKYMGADKSLARPTTQCRGTESIVIGNSRHSERNIRGTCTIACHHQKLGGPV
jgi:hypothetical protein